MSEPARSSSAPPSGVVDLLDDYRRRREALRQEARELAQLQAEVLGAAERDAAAIVTDVRAAIGRILGDARRDLQSLSKRVEFIASVEGDDAGDRAPKGMDSATARASLERARREIARALEDSKPEIVQLRTEAAKLGRVPAAAQEVAPAPTRPPGWRPAPEVVEARQVVEVQAEEPPTEVLQTERSVERSIRDMVEARALRQAFEPRPAPQRTDGRAESTDRPFFSALPSTFSAALQSDSLRVWLIAFGIAALVTVLGAALIMRQSPRSAPADVPQKEAPAQPPSGGGKNPAPPTASAATPAPRPTAPGPDGRGSPPASRPAADATPQGAPSSPPAGAGTAGTAPAGAASAGAAPAGAAPSMELTTAAQRWLDAYARRDAATLRLVGTRDMKLADQRAPAERLPPGAENVRRTLENVSFQFVGETSILTARMIEQGNIRGQSAQYISWISLMWVREAGQWLVADVQILSDVKLRTR
jgi:hypothetical protein